MLINQQTVFSVHFVTSLFCACEKMPHFKFIKGKDYLLSQAELGFKLMGQDVSFILCEGLSHVFLRNHNEYLTHFSRESYVMSKTY